MLTSGNPLTISGARTMIVSCGAGPIDSGCGGPGGDRQCQDRGADGDPVLCLGSGPGAADGSLHAADGDRAAAGRPAGASGCELEATYYLGLMMNVYCHADASEQARWFGDDIGMKGDRYDLLE